jgi:AraC-like DNA-binding protein
MATENEYLAAEPETAQRDRESPVRNAALWVELEIDRHCEEDCPIAGLSNTEANGQVQMTGSRCYATLAFGDDGDGEEHVSLFTASVEDTCACARVCGPGFTPVSLTVENGSLVVRAYVDSRDRLTAVIDSLRESDDEWRLRRLTTPDRKRDIDAGLATQLFEEVSVTEKQREAVRAAVEMGYYDEPRKASLADLASRLGISRSALSQRLNAVESKLVETLASEL